MSDFVTTQGLAIKTVEQILAELSAQQKQTIDATLDTSPDSPVGQMNGIFASQLREVWEALQVAYDGFDPDAAEGLLLEKISALTGTERRAATKGVAVGCHINLDIGKTIQNGVHFANVVGQPGNRWTPKADYTSPSNGVHTIDFIAENAGAIVANAVTITQISTPLAGWNSVANPNDAEIGRNIDDDPTLRLRREEELRASGSATVDAMRADLLANDNILQATVFENVEDVIDPVTGLPPHSMQAVVYDGSPPTLTNDQIAQIIWDSKPGGVKMFGNLTGTATDTLGNAHTMHFDRPVEKDVYLVLGVRINQATGYAGAAALKAEIVKLNQTTLLLGRDVIAQKINAAAMDFPGVWDVSLTLGFAAMPVGTANLTVGPQQLARLDTSRITINETFAPIP